jgi:predicted short-subunit dehydrogenase-like oxidoreductase (DUF2520 family)
MLPAVSKASGSQRSTISIVGPGSLGSALARTLTEAGYPVSAVVVRQGSRRIRQAKALARRIGAEVVTFGKRPRTTDIVWVAVPDDAIAGVARQLAQSGDWKGKLVFHSSGALTSDELAPLRAKGARVASVHPMMTFVRGEVPELAEVAFAMEGDGAAVRVARSIVEHLGGKPFVIKKENKVLYHAFGSFASPLVIALMASMEQVGIAAGIPNRDIKAVIGPLLEQTLRNYLQRHAAAAFTGPLARGDVATIRRHLLAMEKLPETKMVYVSLATAAAKTLPVRNSKKIERELRR